MVKIPTGHQLCSIAGVAQFIRGKKTLLNQSLKFLLFTTALLLGPLGHSFDVTETLFFHPTINPTSDPVPLDPSRLSKIPANAFEVADQDQHHFGFKHRHVILRITGKSHSEATLVIDDRFLEKLRVYSQSDDGGTVSQKRVHAPGFKSTSHFFIPSPTKTIYLEAIAPINLVLPFQFLSTSDAQLKAICLGRSDNDWQGSSNLESRRDFHGIGRVLELVLCGKRDGAKVQATVLAHGRAKKIEIIKFRRRKHHRKQMGHRQNFTELKIESIVA